MNKKGFTLVELLATLIILGIVTGIAIIGVGTSLTNAKIKSEKEFLNQLSNSVDAYISMCLGKYNVNQSSCNEFASSNDYGIITKSGRRIVNVYEFSNTMNFDNIVNEGILVQNDLINPVNGKNCGGSSVITFYRDADYVYYYKIVLPLSCIEYPLKNSNEISTLLDYSDGSDVVGFEDDGDKDERPVVRR